MREHGLVATLTRPPHLTPQSISCILHSFTHSHRLFSFHSLLFCFIIICAWYFPIAPFNHNKKKNQTITYNDRKQSQTRITSISTVTTLRNARSFTHSRTHTQTKIKSRTEWNVTKTKKKKYYNIRHSHRLRGYGNAAGRRCDTIGHRKWFGTMLALGRRLWRWEHTKNYG